MRLYYLLCNSEHRQPCCWLAVHATKIPALAREVRERKVREHLCRQYGRDYVAAEEGAHAARRGIWVGEFELPAQWRRERRIERLLAAPPLTVPTLGARACHQGLHLVGH